jgi:NADH-quinone oxidoreductase subunit J
LFILHPSSFILSKRATVEDIQPFLFWTLAGLTGACAIAVVVSQNIVRAATWLLFTLGGVSGLFFLLGADFVGATQLLVYVGGTLVLVVFAVMLTAQGPFITMRTSAAEWAISGIVGLSLMGALTVSALSAGRPADRSLAPTVKGNRPPHVLAMDLANEGGTPAQRADRVVARSQYTDTIGLVFLGLGYGPAFKERDANGQVRVARTHYFLPFLIVSVHLLVVLIGAAYLARAKRRQRPHGLTTEAPLLNSGDVP